MGLETGSYISDFDPTWPLGTDAKSAGDDHLRLIKTILQTQFPNLSAAMTCTAAELNALLGVSSNVQTQLNDLSAQVGYAFVWNDASTATNAVSGEGYLCDTTSAGFTVTLPATPSIGNVVAIVDVAGTFATNNLTLGRNGSKINGLSEDCVLNIADTSLQAVYTGGTYGWRLC